MAMAVASQFFSIVLFPIQQGLKIPSAFMRKYGDELQKIVFLKVANGALWRVELVDCDNGTWLGKGWKQFAEYYSIKKFHFLVFRYDGNSQFHAHIYDSSASEIEYPFEAKTSTDQTDDDESVQILSNIPTNQETGIENDEFAGILSNVSTNQGPKRKMRPQTDVQDDVSVEILGGDPPVVMCKQRMTRSSCMKMFESKQIKKKRLEKSNDQVDCTPGNQETKGSGMQPDHQSSISSCRSLSFKEEFITYQKAEAFSSTKPFFISFMRPSFVSYCYTLPFPSPFVKKHLTYRGKRLNLVLRVPGLQQIWPVTLSYASRNVSIISGWKSFVQDNNLKMGDVCIFELEIDQKIFNIIIYRMVQH